MSLRQGLDRRTFFGGLGGGVIASALPALARAQTAMPGASGAPRRPNLILFFIDECRADALGTYGNPVCKTPNFDRLASQGTRFAECHVQYPVCGASRASLLTGLPVSNTGHRSLYYFLRRDEPNMMRYLKNSGYDTYWFGKNDALAPESFPLSLTEWRDTPGGGVAAMRNGLAFDPKAPLTMLVERSFDRRQTSDYLFLQQAIRILERREKDKPFCIFLPLTQPHPPYSAPQGFDRLYNPADLPALVPPGLPRRPSYQAELRKAYHLDQASDADLRRVRATYYGQVSYADWMLGELMDAMERTGHADDTVLVASSDHGDYAGDYGLIEKWPGALESCLTHVPLVARMPGGAQGHVVNEMVELYDIMATFLDLAEVRDHHVFFARSLLPQLKGAGGDPKRAAFTEAGYDVFEPQAFEPPLKGPPSLYSAKHDLQNEKPETVTRAAAITTPAFKFIGRPGGQSELYDRKKDPMETSNLIDSRSHAGVQQAMMTRLMNHYISTTGVPPKERDGRDVPEFDLMSHFDDAQAKAQAVLDQ
ncbi:sulfatase-like hydrolase/transferase [Novosphingobium rosa]|uniref:sulfatase-like hydrolase/transferase n=1 Tax=Novosphingobium rosa TaxID=76978 RepID=UPI000A5A583F|nr:sulfatase-like hydrolase/transferase [Novosphingobium rosa]